MAGLQNNARLKPVRSADPCGKWDKENFFKNLLARKLEKLILLLLPIGVGTVSYIIPFQPALVSNMHLGF